MTRPKNVLQLRKDPSKFNRSKVYVNEYRVAFQRTGEYAEELYNEIVDGWTQVKPTFKAQIGLGKKQMFLRILPKGSPDDLKILYSIDRGTRRRTIKPKDPKGFMIFRFNGRGTSYLPKTLPGRPLHGGLGEKLGGYRKFKIVKNHRITPRKFSKTNLPLVRKRLTRELRNATRRANTKSK